MDEREKRALETVFRYFEESKLGISQSMLITTSEMEDLVILTSKYKLSMVLAMFFGFSFITFTFLAFISLPSLNDDRAYGLGLTASGVRIVIVLLFVPFGGVGGYMIVYALNLKHYFIVLHYQGIYYKKIGKPRFISWMDMKLIQGCFRYVMGKPVEKAVDIYLNSDKKVRFNSTNYLFKDKFFEFDDVFYSNEFRDCPFYSTPSSPYRF